MVVSQACADVVDAAEIGDFDAVIIGAGVAGMYQLLRLRELGLRVRVLEAGSDIGGTWYWCRYPGARFDSESWSYGYSFSEELLQEWSWPEHFAAQPDTLRYLNYVADKFDLRRDMQFNSRVESAHFDDATNLWTLTTQNGAQVRAPFMITALGPLSAYTLPNIAGRDSYQGPAFHTARWPHDPVDFTGKRVGIIGTGATAIQTIQTIAKQVEHLTVFQRTPNWAAPLHNAKISEEEQRAIKASFPAIYERCSETIACFIHHPDPRKALESSAQEREAFWEKLYSEPGFGIWLGNFSDVLVNEEANALASEFVAKKIRQRVRDPRIADLLIPKNHGFGTRRLPLESGYYEVYNQDNVLLVDINATPIERITERGIRTCDKDYEFDMMIYATGFDGVTGPYDRIDIRGSGGRCLKDDWVNMPRTLFGMQVERFPNMFMILGPHTARGNIPRNIEEVVNWQTGLIKHMLDHDLKRVEPHTEAVDDWVEKVNAASAGLLSSQVGSWQTGVNRNVEGRNVPRVLGYNGGAVQYRNMIERVAADGYPQFRFG
ncbi:MAG: cation diffusion facilitator CzcD-associated flavoprotein CzcO [Gammaproteobacteria bacterium]|jgi:cation diffusion facilitator CzcD-associated flavoprotein CzcO